MRKSLVTTREYWTQWPSFDIQMLFMKNVENEFIHTKCPLCYSSFVYNTHSMYIMKLPTIETFHGERFHLLHRILLYKNSYKNFVYIAYTNDWNFHSDSFFSLVIHNNHSEHLETIRTINMSYFNKFSSLCQLFSW